MRPAFASSSLDDSADVKCDEAHGTNFNPRMPDRDQADKQHPEHGHRFVKERNAEEYGTDRAAAGPDGVGRA
jgi:hypothetical protein